MSTTREFHYRLPRRSGGWRPGSHPGSSLGAGQEFVSHLSIFHRPDPRRLDIRASLREVRGDWLVRVHRQRVSVPVYVVVDVSASMSFGFPKSKLHVVADFVVALGHSAFRVGDSLGMLAFDANERPDLFVPPLQSRGVGEMMAGMLTDGRGTARRAGDGRSKFPLPATGGGQGVGLPAENTTGLEQAAQHLAGRNGLVFLVSDFHWPLDPMSEVLDLLAHSYVVPLIVWDPAETQPPKQDGLMPLRDMESGTRSTLWLRPSMRTRWQEAVNNRRAELNKLFTARGIRPCYISGEFDGEALSNYFLEATA